MSSETMIPCTEWCNRQMSSSLHILKCQNTYIKFCWCSSTSRCHAGTHYSRDSGYAAFNSDMNLDPPTEFKHYHMWKTSKCHKRHKNSDKSVHSFQFLELTTWQPIQLHFLQKFILTEYSYRIQHLWDSIHSPCFFFLTN